MCILHVYQPQSDRDLDIIIEQQPQSSSAKAFSSQGTWRFVGRRCSRNALAWMFHRCVQVSMKVESTAERLQRQQKSPSCSMHTRRKTQHCDQCVGAFETPPSCTPWTRSAKVTREPGPNEVVRCMEVLSSVGCRPKMEPSSR